MCALATLTCQMMADGCVAMNWVFYNELYYLTIWIEYEFMCVHMFT